MNFFDKTEFNPFLFPVRYERIVSVNMPIRDEYPIIPWREITFPELIIIQIVEVRSRIIPIVRKVRTRCVIDFLRL